MKKSLIAGIIALGCLTATNTDLMAQKTVKKGNRVHQMNSKNSPNAKTDRVAKRKLITERLIKEVGLNTSQATKLRKINRIHATEMEQLRNSRMPKELQAKKMKALRKAKHENIKTLLNKKQLIKYDEFIKTLRAEKRDAHINKRKNVPNNKVKGNKIGKSQTKGVSNMPAKQTALLTKKLGLNKAQEVKVSRIHKNTQAKLAKLNADIKNISREERVAKRKRIENQKNAQIKAVLANKQQVQKYDAHVKQMKAKRSAAKKANKPMSPHTPK